MVALLTPALSATASILIRRGACSTRSPAAAFRVLDRERSLRGRPGFFFRGIAAVAIAFKLAERRTKRYGQYRNWTDQAARSWRNCHARGNTRHWKDGRGDGPAAQGRRS